MKDVRDALEETLADGERVIKDEACEGEILIVGEQKTNSIRHHIMKRNRKQRWLSGRCLVLALRQKEI